MEYVVVAIDSASMMPLVLNPLLQAIVSVPLLIAITIASMSCAQRSWYLSQSTRLLQKRIALLVYIQVRHTLA